jgi:PAS domain S-box-containing protein
MDGWMDHRGTEPDPERGNLRSRAERLSKKIDLASLANKSPAEMQELVDELQVHQVELEMQQQELHAAQWSLQQSEVKYRLLYRFAPNGYFTLNNNGGIEECNFAAAQLLGFDCKLLQQRLLRAFVVSGPDRNTFDAFFAGLLIEGPVQRCEVTLQTKQNELKIVLMQGVSLAKEQPGSPYFLVAVLDLTERKQIEQALRQLNTELEARVLCRTEQLTTSNQQLQATNAHLYRINNDLDNFIYAASHDLKAPIANMEGFISLLGRLLQAENPPPDRVRLITDLLGGSIARLRKTIDQLTDVIKLQQENDPELTSVEPAEVLQEVCQDLEPAIHEAGAHLEADLNHCPSVRFSAKNLRSVVYNLLSNAIKYRSPDRTPHVKVQCRLTDAHTVLSVQDNGLGIDLTQEHKLFTLFGRLHQHVEGSGVGLYMVKKVVENAGGRIEVESQPGQGTTFTVYFKR